MKTYHSVTAQHKTVRLTRDMVLEDSSYKYHCIGYLSAQLCFTFMEVFDIDESEEENHPYSFICRFLKGSIPTWRMDDVPAFAGFSERLQALITLRRFLRAVRNDNSERDHAGHSRKVESCVIANLRTGKSMVVVRLD